jgi:hypothetical protein
MSLMWSFWPPLNFRPASATGTGYGACFQVQEQVRVFFIMDIETKVGDGTHIFFGKTDGYMGSVFYSLESTGELRLTFFW